VVRESRIVRLGQGVDATGTLAEQALVRAFACLDEYAVLLTDHGVQRLRFCATSATRDAANAEVFSAGVRARLGVEPEVLSGLAEARLAFDGAMSRLVETVAAPILVMDVGGGSTELILGGSSGGDVVAHSMDIGSVRLHERYLHSDPPTPAEVARCVGDIDAQLDACPVNPADAMTMAGVAGTFLTVAAGTLGLTAYDASVVDQAVLPISEVRTVCLRLIQSSVAERIALGYVEVGRADVIGAGALIVSRILERSGLEEIVASEADILDGIANSIMN